MNTTQLECFISLASTLNYVKAADQLGMTQPAVSKQIQSLEKEMGAKLFIRSTRSVSLTEIGTHFLVEATSMMNTYYHSKEWIHKYASQFTHSLVIGYSDPHCINLMSHALKGVRQKYPHLVPQLKYSQTDSNLGQMLEGHLDLVVGMKDSTFFDETILFHQIHEESFQCLFPLSHPLAERLVKEGKTSVQTEDVWPYPQIISIPPYLLKNYFSRGRRIVPVNDAVESIVLLQYQ